MDRPLSEIVSIPPMVPASSNIEYDSGNVLGRYIPDVVALDTLGRFFGGDTIMSIMGPYGSGKSTFGVLLNCLLSPSNSVAWQAAREKTGAASAEIASMAKEFRKKNGISTRGMILCSVTARSEPISMTVLRAAVNGAESYFGEKYSRRNFEEAVVLHRTARAAKRGIVPDTPVVLNVIKSMAAAAPVLLMIDEFGKNLEYFADGGRNDRDLFMLQEMAEMSHKLPLHVITIQHMAFGEYATGRDAGRMKEWAKIQGRFSDVHFSHSLDHVRVVLASSLSPDKTKTLEWARRQTAAAAHAGIRIDEKLAVSCYPLHPLAVDVLPELCMRHGQNERTLASFVSGTGPNTVARFVETVKWNDTGDLPHMGLDMLYDYFITGYSPALSSGAVTSRIAEIGTIVRDVRDLDDSAVRTLKAIGVLNLVGSSGKLRASIDIIRCAVGADADRTIKMLTEKSIITYRRHADEYRVWHGTDVDISSKFELWRNSFSGRMYGSLMNQALEPQPVVAAGHGIRTGTMRLFQCRFDDGPDVQTDDSYDGIVLYGTHDTQAPNLYKPVVVAACGNVARLTDAATDVLALRGVQKDDYVQADPVARSEVSERLVAAEMDLEQEFVRAYGIEADWFYTSDGKKTKTVGPASMAVSNACDVAYHYSPEVRNEMINRNKLTGQGANARNRIMDAIIHGQGKPRLGIKGWSAERAVYEAVLRAHLMHSDENGLSLPQKGKMKDAWNAAIVMTRLSRAGIGLDEIYETWKLPPYGIKEGILPILAVLLIAVKHDNVAVYEHGTFTHRFTSAAAERLAKNPAHFRLKWYANSPARRRFIEETSKSLGSTPGMLGIISHLVGMARMLDKYACRTGSVSEKAQAVRDVVFNAMEPDEMIFAALPKALGMNPFHANTDEVRFANTLAKSVQELRGALGSTLDGLKDMLLEKTRMETREKLSGIAAKLLPEVSNQRMKVFVGALAAEIPDDQEWIKYVGLVLTDATPSEWNDEHVAMFRNRLKEQTVEFNRLVALNFSKTASEFSDPVLVTITLPDGSTSDVIVSKDDPIISKIGRMKLL